MSKTDVTILDEKAFAEIEARADAASPRYCVDWEKGHHAWLQDSGWRSASEDQPRTIAAFDKDNGYLDLLLCAEARTDVPALCQTVRQLLAENERLKNECWRWKRCATAQSARNDEMLADFTKALKKL